MLEDELIAGCLNGSKRHFDYLYEKYSHRLYGICLRYSGDEDEAKDILQDGFIKVFRQLKTFDSKKGSFEGWLKRIFVNVSIDYYRKKSTMHTVPFDEIKEGYQMVDETDADDLDLSPDNDLTREQLLDLIIELPIGYRTVFNLYVVEEMAHKEIAAMLGISENTSKTQFYKARQLLKKKIKALVSTNEINSK